MSVPEEILLEGLLQAHAAVHDYQNRMNREAKRRRKLTSQLQDLGRSQRWIAGKLGISQAAVSFYMKKAK